MKKNVSLFVTAAAAAIAVAFVVFLFLPGQKRLAALRESIGAKQVSLSQATHLPTRIAECVEQTHAAEAYRASWRANAPKNSGLADLFHRMTSDASQAGVTVMTIHPQPEKRTNHIRENPVQLRCEGTFAGVCDFVRRIEVAPESIFIESMNMEPSTKDGQLVRCELMVSIFGETNDISD